MRTEHDEPEPIEPRSTQQLYLDHKASEYAEETVQARRYRTNHFVEWCGIEDIDSLNDLTGRSIQRYRLRRQETGDLAKITLNQQMSTIRVFLKWAGSIEAVPANLYDKVMIPRVTPEQEPRDETLSSNAASDIWTTSRRSTTHRSTTRCSHCSGRPDVWAGPTPSTSATSTSKRRRSKSFIGPNRERD